MVGQSSYSRVMYMSSSKAALNLRTEIELSISWLVPVVLVVRGGRRRCSNSRSDVCGQRVGSRELYSAF